MRKSCILLACILALGLICGSMPVSAASDNVFSEDLFSSAEVCGEYFANAEGAGTVYEEVDGEDIMTIPAHTGLNYLYTKSPIPYDTFTVTFDFYIIISPDSHFHEMDFLFGMTGGPKPFHQATLTSESGSLYLRHYTLVEEWYEYKEDTLFYDVYDEESWQTFTAEITPEEVSVYLNGEYLATLTDTEGCVGENGYIGIRGGSAGGWKIKNLKVTQGVSGGDVSEPTEEPSSKPTASPEPNVEATKSSTQVPSEETTHDPEQNDEPKKDGGFPWLIVGIVAAVIVVGGGIIFLIVKKKK